MNDEYFIEQSRRVWGLADKADPFTKKRLLALAESYDADLDDLHEPPVSYHQ